MALRNRRFAEIILESNGFGLNPPPHEWAIVVAFYAAVHFANAYLLGAPETSAEEP
jgi:hypothetical protein